MQQEIAELRHKELLCGILGFVLILTCIIGGLIIGTQKVIRYEMRGSALYEITEYPHRDLGIFIVIIGFVLGLPFLIASGYYSWKREKLLRSMKMKSDENQKT